MQLNILEESWREGKGGRIEGGLERERRNEVERRGGRGDRRGEQREEQRQKMEKEKGEKGEERGDERGWREGMKGGGEKADIEIS